MINFFGQNLKALRMKKELSQVKLSEALKKSPKTIGNWETGYSEPSIDEIIKISNFFDIGINHLLKYEIEQTNSKSKIAGHPKERDRSLSESGRLSIYEMKRTLQEEIKEGSKPGNEEVDWRDTYITFLENRLDEAVDNSVSQQSFESVVVKLLALQQMVIELTENDVPATNKNTALISEQDFT